MIRGSASVSIRTALVLCIAGAVACLPTAATAQVPLPLNQEATSDPSASEPIPSVLAQFTTGVEEREPIDQISFVPNDLNKIFFFSDLRHLTGQTVQHRWIYQGQQVALVGFEVRGPRWRVWSSKELAPELVGDWTVEVVDGAGEVIAAETFTLQAADD